MKFNITGRNEAIKAISAWTRAISLGLMAVALIEPLRSPDDFNIVSSLLAAIASTLTLVLSLLIYSKIEEKEE